MDGMGTLAAAGGIKLGTKRVTAIEACDALYGLQLAAFTTFAKPGGSDHATNQPISPEVKATWRKSGVRFGSFELHPGDLYYIPAGVVHEFENIGDVLR